MITDSVIDRESDRRQDVTGRAVFDQWVTEVAQSLQLGQGEERSMSMRLAAPMPATVRERLRELVNYPLEEDEEPITPAAVQIASSIASNLPHPLLAGLHIFGRPDGGLRIELDTEVAPRSLLISPNGALVVNSFNQERRSLTKYQAESLEAGIAAIV